VSDGAGVPVPSNVILMFKRACPPKCPRREGGSPVESEYELHQTATRIERHVRILIRQRDLIDRGVTTGLRDRVEVDRVEQVQEVDRELEALLAMDVEALSRVQIEACEHGTCHEDIMRCAVAADLLDAVRTVRRRQILAGRWSGRAVSSYMFERWSFFF